MSAAIITFDQAPAFVARPARGQLIATRRCGAVTAQADLQGPRRWRLRTRGARRPYGRSGFTALAEPRPSKEGHNPHVCLLRAAGRAADGPNP
jgi:hypothetical protein